MFYKRRDSQKLSGTLGVKLLSKSTPSFFNNPTKKQTKKKGPLGFLLALWREGSFSIFYNSWQLVGRLKVSPSHSSMNRVHKLILRNPFTHHKLPGVRAWRWTRLQIVTKYLTIITPLTNTRLGRVPRKKRTNDVGSSDGPSVPKGVYSSR